MDLPILLLIFNRPDNAQRLLDQLRKIQPTQLYIGADGARIHKEGETVLVQKARAIFEQIDWDCTIHTLYRTDNLGCRAAVAGAIDWFFEQVEYGVILEDDCLPHLDFFAFCQQMLHTYQDKKEVVHIEVFAKNKVCILPTSNLITNIGFDATATHTNKAPSYLQPATIKRLQFPVQFAPKKPLGKSFLSLVDPTVDKAIFHAVHKSKLLLWGNHLVPQFMIDLLKKLLHKK
jgi:hypothetical protein